MKIKSLYCINTVFNLKLQIVDSDSINRVCLLIAVEEQRFQPHLRFWIRVLEDRCVLPKWILITLATRVRRTVVVVCVKMWISNFRWYLANHHVNWIHTFVTGAVTFPYYSLLIISWSSLWQHQANNIVQNYKQDFSSIVKKSRPLNIETYYVSRSFLLSFQLPR